MNRRLTLSILAFAVAGLLAGGCRSVSVPPAVTGVAIYMLNVQLPADAVVEFKLATITQGGEVTGIVSEQTMRNIRRAPIEFSLPYRPSEIDSRTRYGVTCVITSGERVLFRTARPFPALTHGAGKRVEVLLETIR